MSWTTCAPRKCELDGTCVVHDGKVVWLWHLEHESAVYDPATDTWADWGPEPFGTRVGAVVASVAGTLVVFSGAPKPYRFSSAKPATPGGVRLDAGAWRPMATKNQPSARSYPVRVWTGRELVVWGGAKGPPILNGAAYDPANDTWRKLSTTNAATTHNGEYVWSGTELWLWGGASFSMKRGLSTQLGGFAYHPADDRWRALAGVPGDKEDSLNARSIIRLADAALYVRREEAGGSDDDRCQAWRYDPLADMWEPCTPPPEVRGGQPHFIDCDGRIVLRLAGKMFEYLPLRDAWAPLPEIPGSPYDPTLVWTAGALYAFDRRQNATYRLALPDTVEPVAAPAPKQRSVLVKVRKPPELGRGSPVTAVAIAGDVIIGHADGTVRRGAQVVRKPDNRRILGFALRDGTWACLVGDRLGDTALPFVAHSIAQDGDQVVVAGDGHIATLAWAQRQWTVARQAKLPGTTSALSLRGGVIARAVLGPARRKHQRSEARDTVELIDAATLKVIETVHPRVERGTTSPIPMADGVLVAGGGSYHMERYAIGKVRAVDKLHTDYAWSSPIVMSADGNWLLGRNAGGGGELYDLRDKHRELKFRPFDDDNEEVRRDIIGAHPLPAFLPAAEAAALADDTRCRGTVSAMAIDATGATMALGTPVGATFVIDRDTLGVDAITAAGRKPAWQPACSQVALRGKVLAIGGALGRVWVVRADGAFGELDVETGEWAWGRTLPVDEVRAVREYDWQVSRVSRRGGAIIVEGKTRAVFGPLVSDPSDRGVWVERGVPKPLLVKLDAVTQEEQGSVALPAEPKLARWLVGDRWFVDAGGPHVVETRTGSVTKIDHGHAVGTLDGVHFATPENREEARRWHIYADDLAVPVRSLELPEACSNLAVLPDGAIVACYSMSLAFIDRDDTLVWITGLFGKPDGMCAAGSFLVTWDNTGVVRRWDVRRVFT